MTNRSKAFLSQIAALVIALMAGFLLGRRRSAETGGMKVASVVVPAGETASTAKNRDALSDQPRVVPVATDLESGPRPSKLQEAAGLNHLLSRKIFVPMLSGENLDHDFVALFGLSAAEVKNLNDAIARAKAQLAKLEAARARIEPKGDGKFAITIPPFPKEGGLVLDEFLQEVRSIMGDDRYAFYNDLSRSRSENDFEMGMFGLSQTVVNIEDLRGPNGGPSANAHMGFDEKTGGMVKTVNTGLYFLKVQYPQLYQKLVDTGAIAPGAK